MPRRFSPGDLPATLPVFPLEGVILLPRAHLPLKIFEPRYVQMLEDTLATPERLIGMVQPVGKDGKLHRTGGAGRVVAFREGPDGSYRIILSGVSRFRLARRIGDVPYLRAAVDWTDFADLGAGAPDTGFDRPAFLALLERYLSIQSLSTDMDTLREAEEDVLVNSLAVLNPFAPAEKQALLEAPDLTARRETLTMLMEFALGETAGKDMLQ